MPREFHKMHGAGNDFVLIDARRRPFAPEKAEVRHISDRHRGIGCDQLLVLRDPERDDHLARYDIWNADGSSALQCGNGARCIAAYLALTGEAETDAFVLESPSGPVGIRRCADGQYEVEMGCPAFDPAAIPVRLKPREGVYRVQSPWGELKFGAVSMGNPHALILTGEIGNPDIPQIGAFLGTHEAFPEGCNAGFAQLEGDGSVRLRVVERGSGETLACGSGACAAVAILRRRGRVGDTVDVFLPGGHLVIKWPANGTPMRMKGPAVHVFQGIIDE